ncbi:MAG: ACT domain-containing protein, partial [Planctomycetales bacterium]|nr:ACT domain-containing protein [Planctomycetales bacterium]
PRLMPEARRVSQVSYDEMLELASLGAGVMHSRSIEFAKKFGVPIHVRSSFTDIPGSMIVAEPEVANRAVSGAALTRNEARVTLRHVPDVPGSIYEIFSRIAAKNVTVDMIVQNVADDDCTDISFTVPRDELHTTLKAVEDAKKVLGDLDVMHDDQVAKVSVVGQGMASQAGVADRMFGALAHEGINIQMITTSEIKISALVARDLALNALRAVHRAFDLEKAVDPQSHAGKSPRRGETGGESGVVSRDVVDVVHRLQGMEELTIDDVQLDKNQGRVTIFGVPDSPGVAERVFRKIAAANIFVDMIVQSLPIDGAANLSFTVNKQELSRSVEVAQSMTSEFPSLRVTSSPDVAKLTVSGIGLRSHTGVAIRMFRALAEAKINVAMINTSEVRVNVVVDGADGEKGLACLKQAFEDVT